MSTSILATKLYAPPPRPSLVHRPRLIERLAAGLHGKLTLVSAPAGFGKTTVVCEWLRVCAEPVAWLALDEGDSDPKRFLAYLVAALQTIEPTLGTEVLGLLRSPQPPPLETVLTNLINGIATLPRHALLVLDDYHLLDAQPIDQLLAFLLDHLPPQMHLVITTREDPNLPLSRYRARGQLSEVRASDLRFTTTEAAQFFNEMMGLNLAGDALEALEARTEGWIAGLQLAALSLQGHSSTAQGHEQSDIGDFIDSFTGSHRFVFDYLVEEVLRQQPPAIQRFLLRTSILNRLCAPLCDALLDDSSEDTRGAGQTTLAYLDQANLFLIPLDNERRWYRYHHLFADFLRQRLQQSIADTDEEATTIRAYHLRASSWYEEHNLEVEAFHHAIAADDIERAERLIEGNGMPMHFRGMVMPILKWLETLPAARLDAHPMLWTAYASILLVTGQPTRVEATLQAAEAALQTIGPIDALDAEKRDLVGRIAAIRATAAAGQRKVTAIIEQSRRALQYLHPENQAFRTSTTWKLGYAYQLQGDRAAAMQAYTEVITGGELSGNRLFTTLATVGLAAIQEAELHLDLAAESYRRALELFGEPPLPDACEAYLGLARIDYARNDLDTASAQAEKSIVLARQKDQSDRAVGVEAFRARLQLAQGDLNGAAERLKQAEQVARRRGFEARLPEVIALQVRALLQQKQLTAAAQLAEQSKLACSQARVHLAQGEAAAACTLLETAHQEMTAKTRPDERLNLLILLAIAYDANEEREKARQRLGEALSLAEAGGILRPFIDEGMMMARLLTQYVAAPTTDLFATEFIRKLLTAMPTVGSDEATITKPPVTQLPITQPLIEPLTDRELEVLTLIAQGLSNREIGEQLFLALDTVKGHNRRIFGKLDVKRRTEAINKARLLQLLPPQ